MKIHSVTPLMNKPLLSALIVVGLLGSAGILTAQSYIFTDLSDHPNGVNGTYVTGISGGTTVGYYFDGSWAAHGFAASGGSFNDLNHPNSSRDTFVWGITGSTIFGYYRDSNAMLSGFLYNGSVFTDLHPNGVNGNNYITVS